MSAVRWKLEGAQELKDVLQELSNDFGEKDQKNILKRGVAESLKPVLNTAKSLVPMDTGALRASLRIQAKKPSKRDRNSKYVSEKDVVIGTVTTAPSNKFVKVYDMEASYKARKDKYKKIKAPNDARHIAMELGTVNVPAKPYLRPALESQSATVVNDLADNLKTALNKYKAKTTKGR
jgi:HK97 gp10 family phage protein